jgi:hypothetical protein
MPRRFPIAQFPNRPMLLAVATAVLATRTSGATAEGAARLSRLALLRWSYEEIVSGANWFRRLLGVAGGAYSLITLRQSVAGRSAYGVTAATGRTASGS